MTEPTLFRPTVDSIFKKIFGENEGICISLLNGIFASKNEPLVKSVTFQDTEVNRDIEDGKDCKLDVRAVVDDGSTINIELQVAPQNYYVKRSAYYWAKIYSGQLSSGEQYPLLKRCVCINLLNFDIFKNTDKYHHVVLGKEKDSNEILLPELELHFIEMPKMPEVMYNKATKLEKWLLFLSQPKEEILEKLAMTEQSFKEAYEKLKFLSHDPKERVKYEARLKYLLDKEAEISYAHDDGFIEGKAEGTLEANIKTARNLKALGISIEIISKSTGLSADEIKDL